MNRTEDYYDSIAERIVFSGIREEEVQLFAKYREGKSWRDLLEAIDHAKKRSLGRGAESLFDGIAVGIKTIIEIDTSVPLYEFEQRLKESELTRK